MFTKRGTAPGPSVTTGVDKDDGDFDNDSEDPKDARKRATELSSLRGSLPSADDDEEEDDDDGEDGDEEDDEEEDDEEPLPSASLLPSRCLSSSPERMLPSKPRRPPPRSIMREAGSMAPKSARSSA
jgi:hypothetical protein